jgi:hypothetical protein
MVAPKAPMLVLTVAGVLLACWYLLQYEGEPRPVRPALVFLLDQWQEWYVPPSLFENLDQPDVLYVVPAAQTGPDALFDALRLEVKSGALTPARIRLGPGTRYLPFDSSEVVGVPAFGLRGLSLRRPAFHLFSFPGGGGPGLHFVDSATGVVRIGAGPRTLLTLTVINSSRLPELRARLWTDRARRWAAFLWRGSEGWTLYLFSLPPD